MGKYWVPTCLYEYFLWQKFKFYFVNILAPLCLDMRPPASYRSLLESLRASFQIQSRKREKTHICWLLIYKCIKMTFVLTVENNKSLKKGKILNMHNFRSYIHIVLIKIFIDLYVHYGIVTFVLQKTKIREGIKFWLTIFHQSFKKLERNNLS